MCTASPPVSRFEVKTQGDKLEGVYRRCDNKGCDEYEALIVQSGAYVVIALPGRASFMKFTPLLGGDFVDVATLGMETVINTGKCVEVKSLAQEQR